MNKIWDFISGKIIESLSDKSWKTSLFGLMGAVFALVAESGIIEDPHIVSKLGKLSSLSLGIGLYFARDNNKSSTTLGLK
jgi:hypothetical protein